MREFGLDVVGYVHKSVTASMILKQVKKIDENAKLKVSNNIPKYYLNYYENCQIGSISFNFGENKKVLFFNSSKESNEHFNKECIVLSMGNTNDSNLLMSIILSNLNGYIENN